MFLEGFSTKNNNPGTSSPSFVEAKANHRGFGLTFFESLTFTGTSAHILVTQGGILGTLMEPHNLARQPINMFALMDTRPSIRPATSEIQGTPAPAGTYSWPPDQSAGPLLIGPDPVCFSQRLKLSFPNLVSRLPHNRNPDSFPLPQPSVLSSPASESGPVAGR